MKKQLYKIFKSNAKHKKYALFVKRNGKVKKINFGDSRYQHFKDKTNLKLYSYLDHNDASRRKLYRARASKIRNKDGLLTYKNKNYSNYWSYHYLW